MKGHGGQRCSRGAKACSWGWGAAERAGCPAPFPGRPLRTESRSTAVRRRVQPRNRTLRGRKGLAWPRASGKRRGRRLQACAFPGEGGAPVGVVLSPFSLRLPLAMPRRSHWAACAAEISAGRADAGVPGGRVPRPPWGVLCFPEHPRRTRRAGVQTTAAGTAWVTRGSQPTSGAGWGGVPEGAAPGRSQPACEEAAAERSNASNYEKSFIRFHK